MHTAAVPFLGLEGSLDVGSPCENDGRAKPATSMNENRGSVADQPLPNPDSGFITSSGGLQALRRPWVFATLPARKQPG